MARPDGNFWLADYEPEPPGSDDYPWRPVLQLDGMVEIIDTFFATKRACEEYIRDEILGASARFETIADTPPSSQEIARRFAEVNDRPEHMGRA